MADLSSFTFTNRVRPVVELGIGRVPVMIGTALWDLALWDSDDDTWVGSDTPGPPQLGRWDAARWDVIDSDAWWSGFDPDWYDVTCDCHLVEVQLGRERTTDQYDVGTCSITMSNASGKYDMHLPAPDEAALSLIPGRPIRVGVSHVEQGTVWLFRGYIDDVIPNYQAVEHDVLILNAIDALGEVSRSDIPEFDPPIGDGDTTRIRVARILNQAGWPDAGRVLDNAAATIMLPLEGGGSAADLLAVTVESEGGAIHGDLRGRVRLRARDWQTYDVTAPPDAHVGNVHPYEVCPTEIETSFRRQDIVTQAIVARRGDSRSRVFADTEGVGRYGQETWRAEDLVCALPGQLPILARRQLRVRSSDIVPRVEAVTFDAATSDAAIDIMCLANPFIPHRWRVRLEQTRGDVFNRDCFVTGARHTLTPDTWSLRASLDLAAPFAVPHEHRWEPTDLSDTRWQSAQWQRAR